MFGWLLKLFRHKCNFMVVDNICVKNRYGNYTRYMMLVCDHPLCDNISYIPSENRKIHEELIKKGDLQK